MAAMIAVFHLEEALPESIVKNGDQYKASRYDK